MSRDNTLQAAVGHLPAEPLICLAYLSTATAPFDPEALAALIETSQRNNARRGVTGMLCYYDGSFLQFLEGAAAEVESALAVISRDPRHTGLIEMYRAPIAGRAFPDWSMALMRADQLNGGQADVLKSLRGFEWRGQDAPAHQEALAGFLDAFRMWLR
ncbi:hypothetical protein BH10PSE5_BH10PSE5_31200 [soil metagenome]